MKFLKMKSYYLMGKIFRENLYFRYFILFLLLLLALALKSFNLILSSGNNPFIYINF